MCESVVILGPTASGKSALSLALAEHYDIEIISLDSALIYKGMDIGTAKPSKEELAICPHHLIDIVEPSVSYSAANFRNDCIRLVEEIKARQHLPVICGGTMMYYKALCDGLSPLPSTEPEVRERVQKLADEKGWPYVHSLLKEYDLAAYERLAPNDKQRVARALEVYYMTGRSMSSFYEAPKEPCPFSRVEVVLLPENSDRTRLREQIKARFIKMLEVGLVEEVQALLRRGDVESNMPSLKSVGYRQVYQYLQGELSYDEMVDKAIIATARLAKHQMTWLRGGLSDNGLTERLELKIEDQNKLQSLLEHLHTHPQVDKYRRL